MKPDAFLLAGDIIYRGRVNEFDRVLRVLRKVFDGPIIACFGNEEYDEYIPLLIKRFGRDVKWLNDESLVLDVKGCRIGIVGSRGCLDRPTKWQLKNIPGIKEIYSRRIERIDELLGDISNCQYTVLLLHYSPTYRTLVGESRSIWAELGSKMLERVILRRGPSVVIHGHAHKSRISSTTIGSSRIFNVSLPAVGKVVLIKLPLESQLKLTSFLR